ncbi:hypothetical protein GH714_042871 [Hevea brasiliensis]|uniref:Uncharacterized protein n=1 Tax=Hevea brasiliensis TaxID=3981 RepID=A0A6A6K058_HEVBR|nr:hypothetical protein GH714_042871 [Hevea brasiliensis]
MARAKGVPVRQFVDEISGSFRKLVGVAGFSCDDFIRTTEARHKSAVLALWERLRSNNQIYLGHYAGFYSVRDETFYQERDLVDEICDPEGKFNEVISFVESGLRDLSISRSKKALLGIERTITLVHKECGGKIPEVEGMLQGEEAPIDYEAVLAQYVEYMVEYRFFEALKFVINLSSVANEYIARRAPWKLFKEDRKSAQAVVFKLLEYIRCIGIMLQPFVPDSASKILDQISLPVDKRTFGHFSEFHKSGTSLETPTPSSAG